MMDVFSYIALAIFLIFLIFAICGNIIFGEGNLDKIVMTGPFQVGHKDVFCTKSGAAVSVFYPMDIEEYNNQIYKSSKNSLWLRNGYLSLKGVTKATADWGEDEGPNTWFFKYLEFITMNTI